MELTCLGMVVNIADLLIKCLGVRTIVSMLTKRLIIVRH